MQKKILAVILAIIIIAAAGIGIWQWTGSSNSPSTSPSPSPSTSVNTQTPSPNARNIKVGLVAGYQTPDGKDMDRAARLAVDEINSAGGIYIAEWGTKVNIDLVTADTVDDKPGNSLTPVTRVITEDKVDLLIGGATTGGTLADQVPAISNRVPFLITGASLNLVTRRGSLPVGDPNRIDDPVGMSYMFHYCTTTYDYSHTIAHFFAESVKPVLDAKYGFGASRPLKLAILYRGDGFGRGVKNDTVNIIANENLPINVIATREYSTSATTFQADLTAIKDSKPDAVYVAGLIADTAEIIKEGVNDVKLKSIYIAVEICEDPQFYQLMGTAGDSQLLESKVATQYTGANWYLPKVGTFVANYNQKYGVIPGMIGADTYDAFYIAKDAIERAGSINKTLVRDALETTNMTQGLLMMENNRIQFSTGTNYHEILPRTFVEQLFWNSTIGALKPLVIYPATIPGINQFKQADFVLPKEYEPGSP
jgi:branched-chain amino acid transport system substrate-binding protein